MGTKLSVSLQRDLAAIVQDALGGSDVEVRLDEHEVFVSVLVDRTVFGEIRVEFQDFEAGHWEVHQRVALWNHSVSAHRVDTIAKVLADVGERVRKAESAAVTFMKRIPGARVSSEFEPVKL